MKQEPEQYSKTFFEDFLKKTCSLFQSGQMFFSVFHTNETLSPIFCSENIKSILGFCPEEFVSSNGNFLSLIHPPDQSLTLNAIRDVLLKKVDFSELLIRLNDKNEKILNFHFYLSALKDEKQNPLFLYGYFYRLPHDNDLIFNFDYEREKFHEYLKLYKAINDHVPDVIFTCDFELNTTYISPSIERLTGDTPETHLMKKPHEKHTPESLEKIKTIIAEELENEKNLSFPKNRSRVIETQYYRSDGSIIDISTSISLIRDLDGNPIGLLGVIRDNTKLKEFETELRKQQERANTYRHALTQLLVNPIVLAAQIPSSLEFIAQLVSETLSVEHVSIWELFNNDTELKCIVMYTHTSGTFSSRENLQTSDLPLYFNALNQEGRIYAHDAYNDPRTVELVETYLRPHGITSMLDTGIYIEGKLAGIICCEHIGPPRFWHADEETFISAASSVISQIYASKNKKIAEDALKRSEENLRITLDSIGDAVIATDIYGTITRMNRVACYLTGWNCHEAIGKKLAEVFQIVHFSNDVIIENPIEKVLQTGHILELAKDTTLISKNGYKYQISESAAPILNENKEIVGVVLVFRDITNEYLYTKALANSEKKFRELYHNLRDASHAVDLSFHITEYNQAFQKMLGYNSDEINNITIKQITPEIWHEYEKNIIETQVKKRGYSDLYEKEYIRKDGTVFPVELTTYIKKDEKGNHIGYWAFIRDITEKKLAEKTAKLNYERTQALLNIYQMVDSSDKEICNFALEKAVQFTESTFGYLVFFNDDLSIKNIQVWYDTQHNKDNNQFQIPFDFNAVFDKLWNDIINQQEILILNNLNFIHSEQPDNDPNGKVFIKRLLNVPILNKEKLLMISGVGNKKLDYTEQEAEQLELLFQGMWNIIERKKNLEELEIYKIALDNSTDAISMALPDGNCYYRNKAFYELFGTNHNANPLEKFVVPEQGHEVFQTIVSGNIWSGEVKMYAADKSVKDIYLRAYPIKNNKGEIVHLVSVHTDITEKKQIEIDLIQAKEKAEQSDKLKSIFLANVSHEIRTPMNAILGFLELLKEPGLKSETAHSYIDIINQSGKRLLNTINDIIEISKIESGQAKVQLSEVNTEDLMLFHYNLYKQQCKDKGVLLVLAEHLQGEKAVVYTDRHKLEGILTNLISNAFKFTHEGSIEIGNSIENEYLQFYVKDTGIGIPHDKLDAVFERFVQADFTVSRSHEGSGLGLSIVKAYLEMLDGKIWVISEPGKGSVFYFQIPYKPVYNMLSNYATKIRNGKKNIVKDTILVAEDDDMSFKLIETILHRMNLKVIRTINGEETVANAYDAPEVAMAIIDISLKGMDGLEATKQIRLFNKKIPIIILSAYSLDDEKKKALGAGADEFLTKPVDFKELTRIIQGFVLKQ